MTVLVMNGPLKACSVPFTGRGAAAIAWSLSVATRAPPLADHRPVFVTATGPVWLHGNARLTMYN